MGAAALPVLTFSDLRNGMSVRIRSVDDSLCGKRLQEMGLTEGTVFRVVKVAPFGDPVEIDLRGYRLCLRKRETCGFELETLP